jgi:hypothetical protein
VETLVTGVTAALLTLFDLDRIFYVPAKVQRKLSLYVWWWSFVVINGLLAILLYFIVKDLDGFKDMNGWLKAVVIGIGYLALIRLKFTTFNFQDKEVPFGIEAFYEAGKAFVFKRINNIAKQARFTETMELASAKALGDLTTQARMYIEQDQLISPEEKRARQIWLLSIIRDVNTTEFDKKAVIADYILSGQRSNIP